MKKQFITKQFIATLCVLAIVGVAVGVGVQGADDTAGVGATVTVQNISVSVSDGTVAYGTLTVNTSKDTTNVTDQLNDTQIATNIGNVTENLNIRGTNSTNWFLKASPAADEYKHEFCKVDTGNCDTSPVWNALTTEYQTLKTSLAKNGTYDFDLKITTPNSSTSYDQQSVDLTIQAVGL